MNLKTLILIALLASVIAGIGCAKKEPPPPIPVSAIDRHTGACYGKHTGEFGHVRVACANPKAATVAKF